MSRQTVLKNVLIVLGVSNQFAWAIEYSGMGLLTSSVALSLMFLSFTTRTVVGCALFTLSTMLKKTLACLTHSVFLLALLALWLLSLVAERALGQEPSLYSNALSMIGLVSQPALSVALLFRWNHCFVLEDSSRTGVLLIISALLATFYRALLTIPILNLKPILLLVFPLVTTICAIRVSRYFSFGVSRSEPPDEAEVAKRRFLFFGSRVLWGFSCGIIVVIGSLQPTPELHLGNPLFSILSIILSLSAIAAILLHVYRKKTIAINGYFLVGLPFVMTATILLPYIQQDLPVIAQASLSIAWLVWLIQSYFQLNAYSTLLNTDGMTLAYKEKALTLIAALAGYLFCSEFIPLLLQQTPDSVFNSQLVTRVSIGFTYLLLAISTFAIGRHIWRYLPKKQDSARQAPGDTERFDAALSSIAQQYSLSPREMDIFRYLAQGYSRPYIEKALFISKGTAKTHIHHIYGKLPAENQDGLVEMVRNWVARS